MQKQVASCSSKRKTNLSMKIHSLNMQGSFQTITPEEIYHFGCGDRTKICACKKGGRKW